MLQLTGKFVHVDIELELDGLKFKHLEIESIGLNLVLLQQLSDFLVLPFLFLLSPNAVPLSTSKPRKPMNKSNTKQIKPTLHSNVFFSSTGVAARNHTLLRAILEAQVGRRSPTTRTERSWQTDRKPIKPKWQE